MRVLVRRHLERDALVHAVEAGHAVELGARDLHDRDLAVRRDRQHLLDAVVHLDALRDVERGRGDLRAQRLEHRVAAGHHLGVVVLLRRARRATARRLPCRACPCRRRPRSARLRRLALAGGVPGAVLGLGRRPATLERALVLAARALGGALLALAGARAPGLATGHEYSNVVAVVRRVFERDARRGDRRRGCDRPPPSPSRRARRRAG